MTNKTPNKFLKVDNKKKNLNSFAIPGTMKPTGYITCILRCRSQELINWDGYNV